VDQSAAYLESGCSRLVRSGGTKLQVDLVPGDVEQRQPREHHLQVQPDMKLSDHPGNLRDRPLVDHQTSGHLLTQRRWSQSSVPSGRLAALNASEGTELMFAPI
jgi:hypothetical protein